MQIYSALHPTTLYKARRYREAAIKLPNFRHRFGLGLLIIAIVCGIPVTLAISPSTTDPCYNGTYLVPTGYGSASPSSGITGTTFTFTPTITGCGASGTVDVSWNFGDGVTVTNNGLAPVTHAYTSGGLFTWSLSWHYVAGSMGPPSPPGANGPYSGTVNVAGHWTNGDWSVEPSTTFTCYHSWDTNGLEPYCQAIRAEIKADGQETNGQVDYFQVVLRVYNYNGSTGRTGNYNPVSDYSAQIWLNSPSPGGINTVQPQSAISTSCCGQPTVSLSWSFLGVSLLLPWSTVDLSSTCCNPTKLAWHDYASCCVAVYSFYAEQGADISIPEGQGWTFNFHYRDNNLLQYCSEAGATGHNGGSLGYVCYFDISATITVPTGHVDPVQAPYSDSGGAGGGSIPMHM